MRFLVFTLLLGVFGCGSDGEAGTSGSTGSAGGGASSADSSSVAGPGSTTQGTGTGAGACDGTCVPAPPPGWEGPYEVFAAAGEPPGCDAGYTVAADVHAGLEQPAGTCACDCGAPSGLTCGNVNVAVSTDFTCDNPFNLALTANTCMTNPPLSFGWWFDAAGSAAQGGVCNPSVTAMLDAPSFSTSVRVCSLESPEAPGCDGGAVCTPPRGTGGKLCVAQDGDVACPAGYDDRTVTYAGATDTRTCPDASACSCSVDASCSGTIKTYASSDCTGPSHTYGGLDFAVCVEVQSPFAGVSPESIIANATPTGTCDSAGDLAPQGAVTADGPRTICCAP